MQKILGVFLGLGFALAVQAKKAQDKSTEDFKSHTEGVVNGEDNQPRDAFPLVTIFNGHMLPESILPRRTTATASDWWLKNADTFDARRRDYIMGCGTLESFSAIFKDKPDLVEMVVRAGLDIGNFDSNAKKKKEKDEILAALKTWKAMVAEGISDDNRGEVAQAFGDIFINHQWPSVERVVAQLVKSEPKLTSDPVFTSAVGFDCFQAANSDLYFPVNKPLTEAINGEMETGGDGKKANFRTVHTANLEAVKEKDYYSRNSIYLGKYFFDSLNKKKK